MFSYIWENLALYMALHPFSPKCLPFLTYVKHIITWHIQLYSFMWKGLVDFNTVYWCSVRALIFQISVKIPPQEISRRRWDCRKAHKCSRFHLLVSFNGTTQFALVSVCKIIFYFYNYPTKSDLGFSCREIPLLFTIIVMLFMSLYSIHFLLHIKREILETGWVGW